ncbi:hypothetical protein D3C72_1869600 [compost metagenome]
MARNALADVARTAPIPIIASPDTTKMPAELPSELNTVRLAPTSIEFETASSTAGPGVKHISRETLQKKSQWVNAMVVGLQLHKQGLLLLKHGCHPSFWMEVRGEKCSKRHSSGRQVMSRTYVSLKQSADRRLHAANSSGS